MTSLETHSRSMRKSRFECRSVQDSRRHRKRPACLPRRSQACYLHLRGLGSNSPMGGASREISLGLARAGMRVGPSLFKCGLAFALMLMESAPPGIELRCCGAGGGSRGGGRHGERQRTPQASSAAGDAWHQGTGLGEPPSTVP